MSNYVAGNVLIALLIVALVVYAGWWL